MIALNSSAATRVRMGTSRLPGENPMAWVMPRASSQVMDCKGMKSWLESNHSLVYHSTAITAEIRRCTQSSNHDHRAWRGFIGQGFARLRRSKPGFIVSGYVSDLVESIRQTAGMFQPYIRERPVPDGGVFLLPEALYREIEVDRSRAKHESAFPSNGSVEVLRSIVPTLTKRCMAVLLSSVRLQGKWASVDALRRNPSLCTGPEGRIS